MTALHLKSVYQLLHSGRRSNEITAIFRKTIQEQQDHLRALTNEPKTVPISPDVPEMSARAIVEFTHALHNLIPDRRYRWVYEDSALKQLNEDFEFAQRLLKIRGDDYAGLLIQKSTYRSVCFHEEIARLNVLDLANSTNEEDPERLRWFHVSNARRWTQFRDLANKM